MGKVISISIFKGGTGKTTTAVSISSWLQQLGKRVLLIDLDQQAQATQHVGLDPHRENPNLYHVFTGQIPARMAVKETEFGFSVIPANELLAAIETALEEGDELILRQHLEGIREEYDFVILDSPPGKGMIVINALAAADEVLIPLQAERPALDGVQDMLRFIQNVIWKDLNPRLSITGILPTMFKRTTNHSAGVIQRAQEIWGNKVLPVSIPASIVFPRAYDSALPVNFFDPEHEGSEVYRQLAHLLNA